MDWWRATFPLKLAEATAFTLPLPSYFSIPAMANGPLSGPPVTTPSWAKRYVPCSVASEHFAPAFSSPLSPLSSAYPAPPARTTPAPTTSSTSTTPAAHSLLRFIPVLLVSPIILTPVPGPRGIVGGPNESAMNPDHSESSNGVELEFCELRLLGILGSSTSALRRSR